jgi:hypothetical protein
MHGEQYGSVMDKPHLGQKQDTNNEGEGKKRGDKERTGQDGIHNDRLDRCFF